MKLEAAHAENGEAIWHYFKDPHAPKCPRGVKVQLLNTGFVACYGEFTNDKDFVAWAPCIKRNKELERKLDLI